jgi:hypothetical protein
METHKKIYSKEEVDKLIKSNQVIIQSGVFKPKDNKHVSLNNPREFKIRFPKAFTEAPNVQVTFGNLDHEKGGEVIRAEIELLNISNTSFTCKISTWAKGNQIFFGRTSLAWIAYGK